MTLSGHRWSAALAAAVVVLGACSQGGDPVSPRLVPGRAARVTAVMPSVRISEIHYDNVGNDVGEAVEVSFPVNTDLTGWRIVRFNGATSSAAVSYTTPAPTNSETLKSLTPTVCTGGTRAVVVVQYPQDGLQNGPNDGIALLNGTQVVELLSYEGPFTVATSQAIGAGMTSTDIGVSQNNSTTPIGASMQRSAANTWAGTATNTFGSCNDDGDAQPPAAVAAVSIAPSSATLVVGATQTLTATAADANGTAIAGTTFTWTTDNPAVATVSPAGVAAAVGQGSATITATAPNGVAGTAAITVTPAPPAPASNVRVSEFHYDNAGADAGEQIEVEGDVGGTLAGWTLVLYSGSTGSSTAGQSYATIALSGTFAACGAGSTRGVLAFDATGLQNGDKDGFALVNAAGQVVEFLSYEGAFTAVNGPAAGTTATDVGVSEANAPAVGKSLQRAGNGVWYGPYTSTFGACNPAAPPPPQTGVTFSGRLSSDAALPVGYQDQLFATLRDENTGATVQTTFTWTSETPAIMTVDQRGVVTARAEGTGVIRATAADGTTSTLSLPTEVAPLGDASLYRNPLAFGTPTDDTPGDELRVTRDQYVLSYNPTKHTTNWAAYHLSKTVRGDLPGYRCDCFAVDPVVTAAGVTGISTADYTGSGFDRGHMVRSNDRELARGDQATTYYMSNIVPQYANMNQGRWADLEAYLQSLADGAARPEVYIFTGARGNAGTIANGLVVVPTHTWKVAVVLPAGTTPAQVTKPSDIVDVIAVDMPNVSTSPRDGNWQASRTTVDAIEAATGYDLLAALPNTFEEIVESGDRAPTARVVGAAGATEGQTLTFDASTSSDPDVGGSLDDVLSYLWQVDGANAGIGTSLTHTFADDGTYQIRLIVADKFGAADTAVTMVTVLNASPDVAAFAGATILRGETYQAAGSFADPGDDTWTATVDYGDGTGSQPLALSGKGFTLQHTYATVGTKTVTVTVVDDLGATGTRTAQVTVLSADAAVSVLAGMVDALAAAGKLQSTDAQPLHASLDATAKSLAKLNQNPAANELGAFINKVEAAQQSGRLAAADAQSLIDYARRVIASIG